METLKKYWLLLSIPLVGLGQPGNAGYKTADSLEQKLAALSHDTSRLKLLNQFAWEMIAKGRYEDGITCSNRSIEMAQKLIDKSAAPLLVRFGKRAKASAINNLGTVYWRQANYPRALEKYIQALTIAEEIGSERGMAWYLANIANVYSTQQDYPKALEYYLKAIGLAKKTGNQKSLAISLGNTGIVYNEMKNYAKAVEYYIAALDLSKELADTAQMGIIYGDLGSAYNNLDLADSALNHYLNALIFSRAAADKFSVARHLGNLGQLLTRRPGLNRAPTLLSAENYLLQALQLSTETGDLRQVAEWHLYLSKLYENKRLFKTSYGHFLRYFALRDSIYNEENTVRTTQQQVNYEFEKKCAADSVKNVETGKQEQFRHDEEMSYQRSLTYAGVAGFVAMILITVLSFRAYKAKIRANAEIAKQKEKVEEKQKEIMDSIHYAKRIQHSLLPTEKYIARRLQGKGKPYI